jgi:hypothetical protein
MLTVFLAVVAAVIVWVALNGAKEAGRAESKAVAPAQPIRNALAPDPAQAATVLDPTGSGMESFEPLMERSSAAAHASDFSGAVTHAIAAMNVAWGAVCDPVLEWRAAWDSPPSEGDIMRSLVTVPLEDLCEHGSPHPPLRALILSVRQAHDFLAIFANQATLDLRLPSPDELDALIAQQRAEHAGTSAIQHQRDLIDAAFESLGSAWNRVVDAQASASRPEDVLAPLAELGHAGRDTLVAIRVGLPILLWSGG